MYTCVYICEYIYFYLSKFVAHTLRYCCNKNAYFDISLNHFVANHGFADVYLEKLRPHKKQWFKEKLEYYY